MLFFLFDVEEFVVITESDFKRIHVLIATGYIITLRVPHALGDIEFFHTCKFQVGGKGVTRPGARYYFVPPKNFFANTMRTSLRSSANAIAVTKWNTRLITPMHSVFLNAR